MSLYRYFAPRPLSLMNEMLNDFSRLERLSPLVTAQNVDDQVVDTDKKFAVNLNVSQFKPEELKIDLNGRRLTIEGTQERKTEHGFAKRSFHRSVYLPEDVDLTSVASCLTDDGKLSIEAEKREIVKGKPIPIQQVKQTPEITDAEKAKQNGK